MKINSKFQIKMLLDQRKVQVKVLAKLLSEKTGKHYTANSLSQRISRGSILYDEMLIIAEILNYDIIFINKD